MTDVTKNATQFFFQNSLAEVVRKLRTNNQSEAELLEQYVNDTKKEVGSPNQSVKVAAIQKATYFHMLGYNSSYANFNIVEVMADPNFATKRIAYVAACLMFSEETDVIPLMTALLKRDLASSNQYEIGMALYCLASVCTTDLAKDLVADVVNLLDHPRTYVRKKAVLSLYKIFLQYPESLRPTYPRLKAKLEDNNPRSDNDPAVRGAVVCVLCELARRNPVNFLGLAVPFYAMLSNVHSNWTLIKIVKVFGYFAPLEPRLGKKLMEPLSNLIVSTSAKSVQYECILAVANGMSKVSSLTKLAAEKMKTFVEDADQNLKYLGLDAMSRMLVDNPKPLLDQRDVVLRCLDDPDVTIRRKALTILCNLVSRRNMVSTITHMLDRCVLSPPDEEWSNAVVAAIIEAAQTEDYSFVQDFEWYLGVLLDLCLQDFASFEHGDAIERELVTVLSRVNGVRQYGVEALTHLLSNSRLITCDVKISNLWRVICAAAFVCGEYPHWLTDKMATCRLLLSERIASLPAEAQLMCVSAATKIVAFVHHPCARHLELTDGEEEQPLPEDAVTDAELRQVVLSGPEPAELSSETLPSGLELFRHSMYPEVQECADLLYLCLTSDKLDAAAQLFEKELLPVAAGAQEALELPADLDLDQPFCEHIPSLMPLTESEGDDGDSDLGEDDNFNLEYRIERHRSMELARREQVAAFYLKDTERAAAGVDERSSSPTSSAPRSLKQAAPHGHGTRKTFAINRNLSRPANYVPASASKKRTKSPEVDEATRRLQNIDVTRALAEHERLPEVVPYARRQPGLDATPEADAAKEAVAPFPAVVVLDKNHVRVVLLVDSCKVRKDGVHLRCVFEVANLASASALHDVRVRLTASETYREDVVQLLPAASEGKKEEAAAEAGGLVIANKIKGSTSARQEAVLCFRELPDTLSAPLPLEIRFTKERKPRDMSFAIAVRYEYLTKPPAAVSSEQFNNAILLSALAEVSTLSCFIPCSKAALLVSTPLLERTLRLTSVDIFKDTITLYGVLHGRKSAPERAHVAVLLRELEQEGHKGLYIAVRTHYAGVADVLIHEIAEVVQSATV